MKRLRLAFMGTPEFARPALRALLEAGHEIACVYTQPPRPAGRGQALRLSAVHQEAQTRGLPVRSPARLRRDAAAQAEFAALDLDAAIVAAYGLILPPVMLDAPRLGCLNIHASLLPRWRGAAPIQAAILAGDDVSGVTIMQMQQGLDTGPMLCCESVPITPATTGQSLHDTLAELGARLICAVLADCPIPRAQPEQGVTYAAKLSREDGRLDWRQPAAELDRRVRALHPWPGAFTLLDGQPIKIIEAVAASATAPQSPPGTVLDGQLTVACAAGTLRVTRLQAPGRSPLDAAAFLRGRPVGAGTRLG